MWSNMFYLRSVPLINFLLFSHIYRLRVLTLAEMYPVRVCSMHYLVSPRPMLAINIASGYLNRAYPNKLYGQYQGSYGSGFGYGSNSYGSQNRQGWLTLDNKYRSRGRGNGFFNYNNENSDGLNKLNRGPRARITKNQKVPT
ncbi:hypothetical protein Hanom_Chr16g01503571 [Helianthus anomalus]